LKKANHPRASQEFRRRASRVMAWVEKQSLPIWQIRALEVLESSGVPEGHQWLKKLAAGAPEGRLTGAAKECLKRLFQKETIRRFNK
jgi:hypothetical protein